MKPVFFKDQRLLLVFFLAFLVAIFLTGGSSRADTLSLVVLRPISAVALIYAALAITRLNAAMHKPLLLFAGAVTLLSLIHLVPLPPALWQALPGRDLIGQIDLASGNTGLWRPLAMAPDDAWNAFFFLTTPLAVLLFASELTLKEHEKALQLIILTGLAGIIMGLAQIQGNPNGPLYFYRITNEGQMVGFFANRNHNAIFMSCLIPIIAHVATSPSQSSGGTQAKVVTSLFGIAGILVALVVIGSRGGLIVGGLATLAVIFSVRMPDTRKRSHQKKISWEKVVLRFRIVLTALILAVGALVVTFSRSESVTRVAETNAIEELRLRLIEPILEMSWKYFPFGSGNGSFVAVYKIDEPDGLLGPKYLNHAHNDLLETLLTLGLPGIALILIAFVWYFRASIKVWKADSVTASDGQVSLAKAGSTIMLLLALSSLFDYPLRTPALATLFVLATMWLSNGSGSANAPVRNN